MGFLGRHVGDSGVVTNQALIGASEDMVGALRDQQKDLDASGASKAAAETGRLIDRELDKQQELRRRS